MNSTKNHQSETASPVLTNGWQRVVGVWLTAWAMTVTLLIGAWIQYQLVPVTAVKAAPTVQAAADSTVRVLQLTNQERMSKGLNPLIMDDGLKVAAQQRAIFLLQKGYFGHYYQNTDPWMFIEQAGEHDWHWAGENLAKNYADPEAMVAAWVASPTHRANLLSDHYTRTGIATVNSQLNNGQPVSVTVELFTGS